MSRTISVPYRRTISPFSGDTQLETHVLIRTQGFVTVAIDSPSHCSTHTYTHRQTHKRRVWCLWQGKTNKTQNQILKKSPQKRKKQSRNFSQSKDGDGDKGNRLCRKPSNQLGRGGAVRMSSIHPNRESRGGGAVGGDFSTGEIKNEGGGDRRRRWQLPFFFRRPAGM